jgi:hypothetical protein
MPPRKTTARYSLYRTFVDAYMKGHPDVPRSVRRKIILLIFTHFYFNFFSNLMLMLKLNGMK